MYLVDYHVHTKRCGHAAGKDRQYIEAAIASGLAEMGFSDHVPRFYQSPDGKGEVVERGMNWDDLEEYVRAVLNYRSEYREISIKLGLEVDFVPGWEQEIERIGRMYPWDYLIGSVHFFPEWNYGYIPYEKEHPPAEIYPKYFEKVAEAAETGLYDFLGHIDLPKRTFPALEPEVMTGLYRDLAQRLGRSGAVIELNTYGIRCGVGIYPDPQLLEYCRQQGVRVTLGSDSHRPKDVGSGLVEAVDLMHQVGYEEFMTFKERLTSPKSISN